MIPVLGCADLLPDMRPVVASGSDPLCSRISDRTGVVESAKQGVAMMKVGYVKCNLFGILGDFTKREVADLVCLLLFCAAGLLLGMCMCLPYSEAKLQQWIHALQERCPSLANATIIYKVSEPEQQQLPQDPIQPDDPAENSLLT